MPSYSTNLTVENIQENQLIPLAVKTAKQLGWNIAHISPSGLIAETKWSWNSWGEEIKIVQDNNTLNIKSTLKGSALVDIARINKKRVNLFIEIFNQLQTAHTPEQLAAQEQFIQQNMAPPEDDLLDPNSAAGMEAKQWWKIFIPKKDFLITPLLIDINILLFIGMVISGANIMEPSNEDLIRWGANAKFLTIASGEWWRLFTCMFEHIGVIHLVLNMYALLMIGIYLEPLLGKNHFIISYIATGIIASLSSLWWYDNTLSAGASGAIFGMYGIFIALLTTDVIEKSERQSLLASMGIFVVYNLVYGLKGGVDNAAHIGGLTGGLLVGYILYFTALKNKNRSPVISIASLGVLIAVCMILILPRINDPMGDYVKVMENFSKYEAEGLRMYALPENTTENTLISHIKEVSIPNWQHCKAELSKLKNNDLPAPVQYNVNLLHEYTDYRLELSQLVIDKLSEKTSRYDEDIARLNTAIEEVIAELNKSLK